MKKSRRWVFQCSPGSHSLADWIQHDPKVTAITGSQGKSESQVKKKKSLHLAMIGTERFLDEDRWLYQFL